MRELSFLRDYMMLLRRKGPEVFHERTSYPVLIGVGIRGVPDDMSKAEDRSTMVLRDNDDNALQSVESLVGRVWQIKKRLGGDEKNKIFLGRTRENDLQVTEYSISERHCVLHPMGGKMFIEDLGSLNGCHVSRQRIPPHTPTEIMNQADVLIGRFQFGYLDMTGFRQMITERVKSLEF